MKYVLISLMVLGLAGCGGKGLGVNGGGLKGPGFLQKLRHGDRVTDTASDSGQAPALATDGGPLGSPVALPPEDATTAEEFDTTTPEDRAAAAVPPPIPASGDGRLGTTVASLGDPGEAGFWIKTPLVEEPAEGHVVYVTSGRSVQVQLIPSGGPAGGGSQVSLAAMRLLDAPLAGLSELVVYRN